jgi:outer membrane protein, multidrug efflux system
MRLCSEAGMRQRKLHFLLDRDRSNGAAILLARTASMRRLVPMVGGLCLMHGLSACMLASDKVELAIPIADRYQLARGSSDAALPKLDWWRGFRSSELTTVMELAQAANFDIAAATARIMQADAQARIAGAALLPTVDLTGSAEHSRVATNTATGGTGGISGSGGGLSPERNLFSTALAASYEIDFWGKNRATLLAAEQTAVFNRYDRDVVALTTLVSVANAYFQILGSQDRLRVARDNVAAASRILGLIRERFSAGTASTLDVAQQEALLATQRASVPPLEITLRQNIATLAVLVGQTPEQFSVRGGSMQRLTIPRVTPGIPSDLLFRRPDVRESEAQLASATASIAAARAQFFPSISLTSNSGFQSAALQTLFASGAWQYSLAANLTQPIFHGGQLLGQLEQAKGRQDELLQTYRRVVINSFADVERALVAVQQEALRERLQIEVVRSSREAFRISEIRLREGTLDLITLLNTQQTLFTAEDTLAQVRLARLQAVVSLFQALGGGWPPLDGDKPA